MSKVNQGRTKAVRNAIINVPGIINVLEIIIG